MATDFKTELHIPDLWFDFYARLLPGSAVAAAVWKLLLKGLTPSPMQLFIIGAAGYFCALVAHPVTALVTSWLHGRAAARLGLAATYVRTVQYRIGYDTNRSLILSKMHGETTFFAQLGVLGVAFGVLQFPEFRWGGAAITALCVLASIALGFLVALRRTRRALGDEAALMTVQSAALDRVAEIVEASFESLKGSTRDATVRQDVDSVRSKIAAEVAGLRKKVVGHGGASPDTVSGSRLNSQSGTE